MTHSDRWIDFQQEPVEHHCEECGAKMSSKSYLAQHGMCGRCIIKLEAAPREVANVAL